MKDYFELLGRIMICVIFFFEAYDTLAYIDITKQQLTAHGITWQQDLVLYGSTCIMILGAILVLIGYRSGLGAILLMIYWIPITFLLHDFWNQTDRAVLREHSIHFMKNIAIIGGLLSILTKRSGRFSVKRLLSTTKVRRS